MSSAITGQYIESLLPSGRSGRAPIPRQQHRKDPQRKDPRHHARRTDGAQAGLVDSPLEDKGGAKHEKAETEEPLRRATELPAPGPEVLNPLARVQGPAQPPWKRPAQDILPGAQPGHQTSQQDLPSPN